MERISVIVPIYKVEAYLDKCVQSIVDQTYPNLEIILVDDGSPDNCPAICDAWAEKDSRIKVIHKKNGGLSDARNAGMEIATGDLISFVDSDDLVHPDFLLLMYEKMTQENAEIAACDLLKFFDEQQLEINEPKSVHVITCNAHQAINELIHGVGFRAVAWNKLYRRQYLENEQFCVGKYHEDEFFTYRILDKAEKLVYLNYPLYFYRQREGSIMSTISRKHLDRMEAFFARLELLRQKYPDLYKQDKATFCVSCVLYYSHALRTAKSDVKWYKEKILSYRKRLKFSIQELLCYPVRTQIYIMGSRICLPLLAWVHGLKGE